MKKIALMLTAIAMFGLSSSRAWSLVISSTPTPTPVPQLNAPDGAFQVHTFSNLDKADAFVNLTNGGSSISASNNGNVCANAYVFNPDDTMLACCTCTLRPNSLASWSLQKDLIVNPLVPASMPTSVVVKIVTTTTNPKNSISCNSPTFPAASTLASGLAAWGTNIHANTATSPTSYSVTEQEFAFPTLSATELSSLTSQCNFIAQNGAGFGICRSCSLGGR